MSITLGIYDLFGNMIPGLLYLYVLNEVFREFKLNYIDFSQVDKISQLILLGVAAYVLGHLFNAISYRFWYRLWIRKYANTLALERIKDQNPSIPLGFAPNDVRLLFGIIRHHNMALAQEIERSRASSIMMRNISLGFGLFTLLQIVLIVTNGFSVSYSLAAIVGLMMAALALKRGSTYDRWANRDIVVEAMNYGNDVNEVLHVSRQITKGEPFVKSGRSRLSRKSRSDLR